MTRWKPAAARALPDYPFEPPGKAGYVWLQRSTARGDKPLMNDLDKIIDLVLDVWRNGAFGIDVGRLAVAMGIFIGFLTIRSLFTRFVLAWLASLASRTRTDLDARVLKALEGPLRFVPIFLGFFFASRYLELDDAFAHVAELAVRSMIAFNIFWAFFKLVDPLSFMLRRLERVFTPELVEWLVKAIKAAFVFLGAAAILEIWGIEVGPLLAGLGLFGVAVALGAQDLFKNLISGILILAEKRFKRGDWIKVDGVVEGVVENIGFRSTLIRRFDKAPVYVPNYELADGAVTNFSEMTYRRIYWIIGVEYRSTVDQLRQIRDGIEGAIIGNDDFAQPPHVSTFVRIDKFGDSSIDIMVYCFTKTTTWGEWLEIKERLAYRIKEIVEEAGGGFAFPSRSIYVESPPEDRPEVFSPPNKQTRKTG